MLRSISFGLVLSLICVQTNANELEVFPHLEPELSFSKVFRLKEKTNFDIFNLVTRSIGKNVYLQVLPTVAKVLTNEGHGTGVVISKENNGYLLTNHHVIEGYSEVGLLFGTDSDKEEILIGEVVKYDEISDLALVRLKLEKPGLTPISVNKAGLEIGDDVHAVGHPLGEDWTYTRGYVSQKRRNYGWVTDVGKHHVADVIQTQTPINPGNSGGPLVDNNGALVGINSFRSNNGEGINFAVANSTVQKFLNSSVTIRRPKIPKKIASNLVGTKDKNKNGIPDRYLWDKNGNDVVDLLGVDDDENLKIEKLLFDKNENQIVELTIEIRLLDGKEIGVYLEDENEDGKDDFAGLDFDMDGKVDKVIPASELQ